MKFRVHTTQRAEADIEAVFRWILLQDERPREALRWIDAVHRALPSLSERPHRYPRAPEAAWTGRDIRQLILFRYRVLFEVLDDEVQILHVRHGSRLPATGEDLEA